MTNLKIIPNFKKKTAKFEGVIAAGEKIHATIENVEGFIESTQNLRLRAVASDGGTLAIFPQENELGEVVDNWSFDEDTIECDLNLNTVQMLKVVPPAARVMVLFVLDNPEDETLYFKSFCEVDHWPRRVGEEEPVDLGGYADFVQDAKQSIKDAEAAIRTASSSAQSAADRAGRAEESAKDAQESATGSVGSAATYAFEAETARDEANSRANIASTFADNAKASQTAAESAKIAAETARDEAKGYAESAAGTLANAATKAALQAEVERATAAEDKNAAAIDETGKALATEVERAKTSEQNLANEVSEVGDKVDTVIAGDTGKSARTIAAEEVAKVIAGADTNYDTLKEIADYIKTDAAGAAQLKNKVTNLENDKADKTALEAEVSRATDAEAELGERVKELEENGGGTSVEVVAPSPNGAGKAADAKAVYDRFSSVVGGVEENRSLIGQFASTYNQLLNLKQDALNDGQMAAVNSGIDSEWVSEQTRMILELQQDSTYQAGLIDRKMPLYTNLSLDEGGGSIPIYPFVRNEVSATLEAITVAGVIRRTSDNSVSFGSDIMLDCSLVIDCRDKETAPTITWPINFHPRTDAETDFACEAGKRNVYWITEYAPGEFCVAGWQETDGGGTSEGGNAQ